MWDYSDKVKEHFFNPKNAGAVADANATGEVGSISCGDALRLTLKVDDDTEVILEAGFQTFGCGSAIASSSVLTEMIIGKTIDEALQVTNQDIAAQLEGLPPEKMHCSVMGREALQAAIANYRGEVWKDDHEEGALICKCFAIDAVMIEEMVWANKFDPGAAPVAQPEKIAAVKTPLTNLQRIKKIEEVLESLRPALMADGGDVELVEVIGNTAYVKMTGACNGCQMAAMTIAGIQQRLMEVMGEFIKVVPATEMAKLTNIEVA